MVYPRTGSKTAGCLSLWSNPAPNLPQKSRSADFSPSRGKREMHPRNQWLP